MPDSWRESNGRLFERATVREATPEQEIASLEDFLVAIDEEFFVPVLLSKTVRFDDVKVTPFELRRAPRRSLVFLEEVYRDLNGYSVERRDEREGDGLHS